MERQYLLKTIRMAMKQASGRPLDEAAEIVADNIIMIDEILSGAPASIIPTQSTAGLSGIPVGTVGLSGGLYSDSAKQPPRLPINPAELTDLIERGLPPEIEVVYGEGEKGIVVTMVRSIIPASTEPGDAYFGLLVDYTARQFPNITCRWSFFAADGEPNIAAIRESEIREAVYHALKRMTGPAPRNSRAVSSANNGQIVFGNKSDAS